MAYNLIGQHTVERDGHTIRLYGDGESVSDTNNFVIGDINNVAGKRTSQIINWRLPHKLEIPVIDKDAVYANMIRDESPVKFRVELDDPDGNLIYKGYVATKLNDYEFHQDVIQWTMTTYDGVTVLKREPIGNDFSNYMTLGEAFRVLLNKVGHNMNIRILTDLEHVNDGSGSLTEKIRGVWEEMIADQDNKTYYKLLKRMLEYYKFRMVQSDGYWYIQQRNMLNNSSWSLIEYPADTSQGAYTINDDSHIINIPHDPGGTTYNKESVEQTIPGIISYQRAQSISHPPFKTTNGRFKQGDFTGWNQSNASIYSESLARWGDRGENDSLVYSAIGSDNMAVWQKITSPIRPEDSLTLTMHTSFWIDKDNLSSIDQYEIPLGNVRLIGFDGSILKYLQLSTRDHGKLRYKWANPDEQWQLQYDSNNDEYNWVMVGEPATNYRGISYKFYLPEVVGDRATSAPINQLNIETPTVSGYEYLFVELDFDPYSNGNLKNDPSTGELFKLFHFYVMPEDISDTSVEMIYNGTTNVLGDGAEIEEQYVYGDRLPIQVTTDTQYLSGSNSWLPTFRWDADDNNIHEHIIKRVAGQGTRPQKELNLSLAYLGSYKPKIHQCVQFDGIDYEVQQVKHSIASRKYEVYLVEISQNVIAALNEIYGENSSQETVNSAAQSSKESIVHIEDRLENFYVDNAVTSTTSETGHLVNSIDVDSIGEAIIKAGEYIYLVGRYARPIEFEVESDVGANDSTIQVVQKAIDEKIPAGSKVLYTGKQLKTAITQNANAIALKAPKILIDTDIFRDQDWNGDIDTDGNITTFASQKQTTNPSFAVTGRGHFEFTDGKTFWRYNGGDIESILDGGSKISNPGGDWSLSKSGLDLALAGGKFNNPERRVSWGSDSYITSIGGTFAEMYIHHRDRIRMESTIDGIDDLRTYAFITRTSAQLWAEDDTVPQQRGFQVRPDEFRYEFNDGGDVMNIQSIGDSGGVEAGWVKVTIKGTTMYLRAYSTK